MAGLREPARVYRVRSGEEEKLFRHKVLALLRRRGQLSQERNEARR